MMTEPTTTPASDVVTLASGESIEQEIPVLRLRLKKPKTDKQVQWSTETVDNEFMNKKKSKCCCIYEKKKLPTDESSDEDSDRDECDHCHGHVELRVKSKPATAVNLGVKSEESSTIIELSNSNDSNIPNVAN